MAQQVQKKNKHTKKWVGFYLTLLIILYLAIYAVPRVSGVLTPTVTLTYDELKVWDEVTCHFIRSERVYHAKEGGTLTYYVPEGTLTRKGTKILDVTLVIQAVLRGQNLNQIVPMGVVEIKMPIKLTVLIVVADSNIRPLCRQVLVEGL